MRRWFGLPTGISCISIRMKMLKFQYLNEISVFPGPKTQDSRFSEKKFPLNSWVLRLGTRKYRNFSILLKFQYFLVPRPKTQDFQKKRFPLNSWVLRNGTRKYRSFSILLKFQYFLVPRQKTSRFSKKVPPELLSLASWDQEIQKFQYLTEISVFLGPKTQDSRFSEKGFPWTLESCVMGPRNTEISVFYWNFSISWSQDPRLKIFRKSFPWTLESRVMGPGNTEISVFYWNFILCNTNKHYYIYIFISYGSIYVYIRYKTNIET